MITKLIDEAIQRLVDIELNCTPGRIPKLMRTGKKEDDEEYWEAIPSGVTSEEIKKLEKKLDVKFSPQYIELLKHRHFLELSIGDVDFFPHPSKGWQKSIIRAVLKGYPREYLLDKGFLPFAEFEDWGMWCFNLNEPNESGEYAIYLWDHERPEELKKVGDDLCSSLVQEKIRYKEAEQEFDDD